MSNLEDNDSEHLEDCAFGCGKMYFDRKTSEGDTYFKCKNGHGMVVAKQTAIVNTQKEIWEHFAEIMGGPFIP